MPPAGKFGRAIIANTAWYTGLERRGSDPMSKMSYFDETLILLAQETRSRTLWQLDGVSEVHHSGDP